MDNLICLCKKTLYAIIHDYENIPISSICFLECHTVPISIPKRNSQHENAVSQHLVTSAVYHFPTIILFYSRLGRLEVEINNRIEKTLNFHYSINFKFIGTYKIFSKTKIIKSLKILTLTFGCESRIVSERQKSKIQTIDKQ